MEKNYYEILELGAGRNVTPEEIKKAYRRLSKKYHPDVNPGNREAEGRFREISEAYAVLGDEEKRKEYDKRLKPAGRQSENGKEGQAGKGEGKRRPENQEFDINNISGSFERFFGFHPKAGEIHEEQLKKTGKQGKNPLDVSDLFERYMGVGK